MMDSQQLDPPSLDIDMNPPPEVSTLMLVQQVLAERSMPAQIPMDATIMSPASTGDLTPELPNQDFTGQPDLGEKDTPGSAENDPMEGLASESPVQAQILLDEAVMSPAPTEELPPELPNQDSTGQIPVVAISSASNASTEELFSDSPVHPNAHKKDPPRNDDDVLRILTEENPSDSEIFSKSHLLIKEANTASNFAKSAHRRHNHSEQQPSRTLSLNMTQMMDFMDDQSSDSNEADSDPRVDFRGYKVKKEAATILKGIVVKYGDIAKETPFSVKMRSSLLEMVCEIYKNLEVSEFKHLTSEELENMLKQVEDLEILKIEVGWLKRRLDEISKAKKLSNDVSSLKKEKSRNLEVIEEKVRAAKESKERMEKCEKALEVRRKQLEILLEDFRKFKETYHRENDELAAARAEKDQINEKFLVTKAKFKEFYQSSLVHGLI